MRKTNALWGSLLILMGGGLGCLLCALFCQPMLGIAPKYSSPLYVLISIMVGVLLLLYLVWFFILFVKNRNKIMIKPAKQIIPAIVMSLVSIIICVVLSIFLITSKKQGAEYGIIGIQGAINIIVSIFAFYKFNPLI